MKNVREIIYKCYSECPRSVELYHNYAGLDLSQLVDNFMEKINKLENFEFHDVYTKDNDLVGYYGVLQGFELPILWTFFVRPKYRKTNILWENIEKGIDGNFIAGVFTSNKPAVKFLKNHGGKEVIDLDGSYFLFERG